MTPHAVVFVPPLFQPDAIQSYYKCSHLVVVSGFSIGLQFVRKLLMKEYVIGSVIWRRYSEHWALIVLVFEQ